MPIQHKPDGWYWGGKGPFKTRAKAQQVATAAYASGYKKESVMDKTAIGEFIGNLFHSSTITHLMHLQTRSYSQHKALGHFYEDVIQATDSLAEAIQGCTGEIITAYPSMFANVTAEPLAYMEALREYVDENRGKLPMESNIQNEVDAIATLIDSTIYKLKFLA